MVFIESLIINSKIQQLDINIINDHQSFSPLIGARTHRINQSEASIQVTWQILTNQRPVFSWSSLYGLLDELLEALRQPAHVKLLSTNQR